MACSSVGRLVGEVGEGLQGLFKVPHGFPVGGPGERLGPCLPAVRQGLVPHLAPHGVLGQAVHLLGSPVASQRLQDLTIWACSARRRSWSRLL